MNLNLKRFVAVVLPLAALVISGAAGCMAKKPPQSKPSSAVLDVAPAPVATVTPQPQFEPVAPPPPQPAPVPVAAVSDGGAKYASAGGSYTVKKGDTLFSIAKTHYGSGGQWQKIAAANPGLQPSKLRVGQTITLP